LEKAPVGSAARALSDSFIAAKRETDAASEFVRVREDEGRRFNLTGRGDLVAIHTADASALPVAKMRAKVHGLRVRF
jgi:hypothetical protein